MLLFPHRFRPPKKTDDRKWETVRFLIDNGFYYQHIYKPVEAGAPKEYAAYPDNLRDAKEFVEKYKSQARAKDP